MKMMAGAAGKNKEALEAAGKVSEHMVRLQYGRTKNIVCFAYYLCHQWHTYQSANT